MALDAQSAAGPPQLSPPLPKEAPLHKRALRFVWRLGQGLHFHNALDAASAMAFHFFLSLIPLLVVLGYVLGLFVRQRGVEAFMAPLLDATPQAATEIVRRELERLAGASSSPIAPVGVLGFLWIASSGMHGLMNVFETALGAARRSWLKKRAIALVGVLGSIVAISLTASVAIALEARLHSLENAAAHRASLNAAPPDRAPPSAEPTPAAPSAEAKAAPSGRGRSAPAAETRAAAQGTGGQVKAPRHRVVHFLESRTERWAIAAIGLVLGLCGLAAFYRFSVEHPAGVKRRAWPGALVAMSAFLLVSWAFGEYVTSLGSYALFYGGLAAVAVLLFWFYLTSLALLLGAEVNAQLEGVRDK